MSSLKNWIAVGFCVEGAQMEIPLLQHIEPFGGAFAKLSRVGFWLTRNILKN